MSVITAAIYNRLSADGTLTGLLSSYGGNPAIFTSDPAPGDAVLPYIVSAGEVSQVPADTKNSRGRQLTRDVRCYAADDGSVESIEAIAEQVRTLLHRFPLVIVDFETIIASCSGPIVADERDIYGRIISISLRIEETGGS